MNDGTMAGRYAIVGIGCRFPGGANSPDAFWELLRSGRDVITEIPPDRPDWHRLYDPDPSAAGRIYARLGGFVEGIDQFDPRFFGISPREASRIDPQQRLLLEVVWDAFEDGRIPIDSLAGSSTGVFVGISTHDYADVQMYPQNREAIDSHSNTGGATAIAANRISYAYDFRGPSLAVDTACSSALTAVHLACRALDTGDCSLAVAGGAQLLLRPELTIGFCRATMLSVDGRCKAFDEAGNGYVRSEGAGAVVLKPLARAVADCDRIYAVVLGSSVNQDGRSAGLTVPSEDSQRAMLQASLHRSGLEPRMVQYVEAHGTGTAVGDPIEARAIGTVFAEGRPDEDPLRIGSVKTNIGHLEAASGIAGLIKTALSVHHRQIPASLHFKTWNPAIDAAALKLSVVTELQAWPDSGFGPSAAVNSFGFGGANASVVLGAAPDMPAKTSEEAPSQAEILVLSARSPEALKALARSQSAMLLAGSDSVAAVCGATALGRAHNDHRVTIVAATREALADGLDAFVVGDAAANIASGRGSSGFADKLAFVFSGMGPQWWGMGRQLLQTSPVFIEMMERCDRALRPYSDWSLLDEFRAEESASRLGHPQLAQVTNFALQVSLAALWRSWGIAPAAVIGHSGGAMAAACEAGVHSLEDAIWLAYHRSRLQGRDTNSGEMLAVGLPSSEADDLIRGHENVISLAAVNGPSAMTLAGDGEVLRKLAARLQERQVFARMLAVTIAYHSPKMDPIRTEFLETVGRLRGNTSRIPLVSDTTGTWEHGADCDAEYWWRAIRQPVRFADSMFTLVDAGYAGFVEISPHPVLASSINECLSARGVKGLVVPSLRRNEDERAIMLRSLGSLYAHGGSPDWSALYRRDVRVPLPRYPFQRDRHWFEPGEGGDGQEADVAGEMDANPLLGRRLASAQPIWEARLGEAKLSYVDDHLVQDSVIFPGACYVATALAAALRLDPKGSAVIRDVEFLRPLIVTERAKMRLQTIVSPENQKVRIYAGSATDRSVWPLYASASISKGSGADAAILPLAEIKSRLTNRYDPAAAYERLKRRGLNYGPRFNGISELRLGKGEALAKIGPVPDLPDNPDGVHPALLDATFQLLAVVADAERPEDDQLFLPTKVEEVQVHRPASGSFWAYCKLTSMRNSSASGSFQIVDDEGAPILSVRGLNAQLVEAGGAEGLGQWLYDYRWEPKTIEIGDEPPRRVGLLSLDTCGIRERADEIVSHAESETKWSRYYHEAEPVLSDFAAAQVLSAFKELGLAAAPHEVVTAEAIERLKAVEPSGGAWTDRLIGLLIETECVEPVPEGFRIRRVPSAEVPGVSLHGYETDIALLAEAGRTLAAALSGERTGKDSAFTAETLALLTRFYSDAPASAFYNRILSSAVGSLLGGASKAGSLRVLEVGAGTGGATGVLLGLLPQGTRYVFSDTASLLLDAAADRFATVEGFETRSFDLSTDFESQGLQPSSFDLIVAANVVHATPSVHAALERLKTLLLPSGVLAMIEITRHPRWLDVIFGQTRGWWAFEDRDLRRDHPLLESADWTKQLLKAGFDGVWMSSEPAAVGEAAQTVILASKPRLQAEQVPWLVLSGKGGIGEAVAARLQSLGGSVVTVARSDVGAILDGLATVPRGIIHLWGLEKTDDFQAAQSAGVHSALELIQGLLARESLHGCPLWIVTAGASTVSDTSSGDVLQSPVWGLGRTVLKEHPDLPLRLVDLAATPCAEDLDALVREMTEHDLDEEIALRGSRRFVRRLRRVNHTEIAERKDLSKERQLQWRAEFGTRGSFGSLQLREFDPSDPAPNEVRVDIRAASLNFRDVMLTTGNIPGLEGELSFGHQHLGSDCAGVISAVGSAVQELKPGDAVMGMAPGALGSQSTTASCLLVKKPPNLSFEEAATLPTVFLTAWYALAHLARLRKGERVLIHAATGGVGLAAIKIAQDVGAEIFATAGSNLKRDYLRSLGIEHVMDSRSLAFADKIRELTDGRGVDVVLNSLTGEAVERGVACLRSYGRFVELGKMDIYSNNSLSLGRFRQNLSYFAVDLDRLCAERPQLVGEMLRELNPGFESGRFRPLPRHDFDMPQLEDAFRLMAQARHIGKIVVANKGVKPDCPTVGGLDRLLRNDGTYLITGGLGGFGLEVAEYLAGGSPGAIVLMGRSPPGEAANQRIAKLRAKGLRIETISGDVSLLEDVDAVLDRIQRDFPPLRGVFHGAMVLDDKRIEDLDAAALDRVMAPKALGAWHLHGRTAALPLDHFVMFSSISSLLGNPLQANYSAASAFLDELAHHRHAAGLPALTINWGVLSGSGYVAERPELQGFLEQQGYRAFTPKQALRALGAMLDRDTPQIMAASIDWSRLAAYSPHAASSPRIADLIPQDGAGGSSAAASETLVALACASVAERPALLEGFLCKAVGRVLGTATDQVETDRTLDDMGLDSLLAVELMVELTSQLGFEIPVIALLDGMTVSRLAGVILREVDFGRGDGQASKVRKPPANAKRMTEASESQAIPLGGPAADERHSLQPPKLVPSPQSTPRLAESSADEKYASIDYARWSPMQSTARALSRMAFATLGKVRVEGLENLPQAGPFILAVNHLSMADVPLALTVMPRRTIILANERLRQSLLLDWLVGQLGEAIYVPKGGDASAALKHALDVLANGGIIALSPEGTRSPSGLKRAHTGVAWLAQRSGLPVVPYVAWGQEQWRRTVRRFARMDIAIRIGEAIPPPPAILGETVLREYADNVMLALARMLPPAYRGAYADPLPASKADEKEAA